MRLAAELCNLFFLVIGSALLAVGVALFLAPNRIASGGTPGMAILLNYLLGLPIGLLMVIVNIPLLLAGWKILGRGFAFRSLGAIILSFVLVDLMREVLKFEALSHEPLLAALYGGILIGAGVGLVLKGQGSAGGTTIIARLIAARSRYSSGQVLLAFDFFIIAASAIVFQQIDRALWSLICIYVTARAVDLILTGGAVSEKIVHITSNRADLLKERIVEQLGQYGTILHGEGLLGENKKLIFLTVDARRVALLKEIVRETDGEAFMVVMNATELLGRGHGL